MSWAAFCTLVVSVAVGAWFLGNFAYDFLWGVIEARGIKQADFVAYAVAHGGALVVTVISISLAVAILRREQSAGHLIAAPSPISPRAMAAASPEKVDWSVDLPRHDTAHLRSRSTPTDLWQIAEFSQEVVPHVLCGADTHVGPLIEELVALLKGIVLRQWQILGPSPEDGFEIESDPNKCRLARIDELLRALKGRDVRVCADTHFKYYQEWETPWLPNARYWTQLHVAFASEHEYERDESVIVPIDHGKPIHIPSEPIFFKRTGCDDGEKDQ